MRTFHSLLLLAAFGPALCAVPGALAASSVDSTPAKPAAGADAPQTDLSNRSGALSDKLNQTNGVIHPEGSVDPQMQKPAPPVGSTPVIPPPGGSGNTDVQPK